MPALNEPTLTVRGSLVGLVVCPEAWYCSAPGVLPSCSSQRVGRPPGSMLAEIVAVAWVMLDTDVAPSAKRRAGDREGPAGADHGRGDRHPSPAWLYIPALAGFEFGFAVTFDALDGGRDERVLVAGAGCQPGQRHRLRGDHRVGRLFGGDRDFGGAGSVRVGVERRVDFAEGARPGVVEFFFVERLVDVHVVVARRDAFRVHGPGQCRGVGGDVLRRGDGEGGCGRCRERFGLAFGGFAGGFACFVAGEDVVVVGFARCQVFPEVRAHGLSSVEAGGDRDVDLFGFAVREVRASAFAFARVFEGDHGCLLLGVDLGFELGVQRGHFRGVLLFDRGRQRRQRHDMHDPEFDPRIRYFGRFVFSDDMEEIFGVRFERRRGTCFLHAVYSRRFARDLHTGLVS